MVFGTVSLVLAGIVIFLTILWRMTKRRHRLPPGPPSYPLVGSMLSVKFSDFRGEMRRFRKLYGDVYSIMISYKPVIVFNGLETLKELLIKYGDVLSDRPHGNYFLDFDLQHKGIIGSNGRLWKEHRTFTIAGLRSFGFGKRSFESQVAEEVTHFLKEVEVKGGKAFRMADIIPVATSNIICSISFGKRFEYTDKRLWNLIDIMNNIFVMGTQTSGVVGYFPWMRILPWNRAWSKKYMGHIDKLIGYIEEIMADHKANFDENNIADYIDDQLSRTIKDLFFAGSETTATTIQWACYFFMKHPEVQERMRKEIEDVVGFNRRPSLADKPAMSYTEAVISEVQRLANIAPIAVLHTASEDLRWREFVIPKDCSIIVNLDTIHSDEKVFPEPDKFKPERFLTADGRHTGAKESTLPFGTGRRRCMGEHLAMMELFLFLTSLIQKFQIFPEVENKVPTVNGTFGLTWIPDPFNMRAVQV